MKQANNNEMDLLLRGLARRQRDRSLLTDSLLEDQTDSPHLDADELSAYAERTLPAATRARYTMHLADCAQCRKIVVELAPVVAASTGEQAAEHGPTSWWQTVRHFFSWPVLRFAGPALSLLAFVVVGLVVFRDWSGGLTARRAAAPQAEEIAQTQPTQTTQEEAEPQKSQTFDSPTGLDAEHQAKTNSEARTGAAKTDATTPAEAPAVNLSKDAGEAKPAATAAPPTYAPEPAGSPAPKPQEQVAEVRRETAAQTEVAAARPQSSPSRDQRADTHGFQTSGDRAKEEERARANAEIRVKAEDKQAKDKQAEADRSATTDAVAQNRAPKLHTLQAGRGEGAGKKVDDEAAQARSVAGRRFLRQGGMWVDAAYKSGISLTHVARGSEQYRALIADEPAIRSVAEQLKGEVILIWKGRGYRIR